MGAGFQVVLGDLDQMATTFSTEARTYQSISAKLNPPVADSGDGGLNEVMQGMLSLLSYLHGQMAASIDENATSLGSAKDAYAKTEMSVHDLYNNLMPQGR